MRNSLQELENGALKLLIPTPNSVNKCGLNTDHFIFNPHCTSKQDLQWFKFIGIMFGVAVRTKKPLDIHLALPMWKLLAGMLLTHQDLEEVCATITLLQWNSSIAAQLSKMDTHLALPWRRVTNSFLAGHSSVTHLHVFGMIIFSQKNFFCWYYCQISIKIVAHEPLYLLITTLPVVPL